MKSPSFCPPASAFCAGAGGRFFLCGHSLLIQVAAFLDRFKGDDLLFAVILRQPGHAAQSVGSLTVEQFKLQLGKDVLLQLALVRVKTATALMSRMASCW